MENTVQNPPPNQKPPKTWLAESILVTLFCFWPLGIPAIVYAAKVESRFLAGRIEEAEQASREAGKWTKLSFWIAIALWVIFGLLMLLGVVGAIWENEAF